MNNVSIYKNNYYILKIEEEVQNLKMLKSNYRKFKQLIEKIL